MRKLSIVALLIVVSCSNPMDQGIRVVSQDQALASSGVYKVIISRCSVPGKFNGYSYEYEIAVDATGHNIKGCPGFNGKKHLNIKVWRKNSSRKTWETIHDLHVLVTKCEGFVYDSRAGIPCTPVNYCSGTIGAVGGAITVYAVKTAIVNALRNSWPVVIRAAAALI